MPSRPPFTKRQATNINDWDAKRGDYERCLDSALAAGRAHSIPSAPDLQKMMEFGMAMAAAQQRGDTAEVRRIIAAVEKAKAPTRADTLAAVKVCGPPPAPSAIIKQWYQLKAQLDSLGPQKTAAEDSVRAREEGLSGMNGRQSAVFCERIKAYIAQLKARQKNEYAFTDDEIKTMTNLAQAIKDLEALCP